MARKNYAYVNCSMLKWAREETPFRTLEEVELHLRGILRKIYQLGKMELTYHRLLKQRSWLSYTKYP